jgi:hypothetical protein
VAGGAIDDPEASQLKEIDMKWHREIDYHGSQAYGGDERPISQFRLTIAWLLNAAKEILAKLATRPSPPTVLLHDGKHSFSLLGADSPAALRDKAASCAFPLKASPPDKRDWRVLP